MWKKVVADYFSFTKKERTGILVLLFLIAFFITLPFLYPLFLPQKPVADTMFKQQMEALTIKQADSTNKFATKRKYDEDNYQNYREPGERKYYSKKPEGELFNFDPNTLSEAGWKRLGIRDKTISTIQNFVSKGGHFYKPTDLGKIWGLHEDEVQRLIPFVQIENTRPAYAERKTYEAKAFDKGNYTRAVIDINTADTALLIALPGIGSKLSQRILTFRDKLGGFYKVEQIGETFGLQDSVFQKIKDRFAITTTPLRQININTATVDEMKVHPYLHYVVANAIVQYRLQHGNYAAVEDIKKIMLITDEVYSKAAPYLKIN